MQFHFGHWYEDVVTGFSGICIGKCSYMTGCDQVLLTRPAKERGEEGKSLWFDVGRLAMFGAESVHLPPHAETYMHSGGDISAPVK